MQVFLVFALLIALVAVIFAVQNTAMVTVSFLVWNFNHSLAVIILLTIFTGVLISILMSAPGWIRNRLTLASLRKKIKELETKFKKEQDKYQAAMEEMELYKLQAEKVEVLPTADQETSLPPTSYDGVVTTSPFPEAPQPVEPSTQIKESVKKSKFPYFDRIFKL
jgi:uncharacterized integral membrane protein